MSAARPLLLPFVPLYRLGLALLELALRMGLEKTRRLQWPVISIGNLSTGGSGKTPLTIALAKALAARGVYVDVLSRGYGRRSSALPLLVESDGKAEEFGDEPLLIAREAGVPVYVAVQRYEAGLLAEGVRSQGPREQATPASKDRSPGAPAGNEGTSQRVCVHLLDDGFQHRQLVRDTDILLLDHRDLADHLLPAGNLRESLRAVERADVIAIPADQPEVADWLKSFAWQGKVWRLRRCMDVPKINGPAVVFCGIARPEQLFEGLERAGVQLAARITFADHHRYTAADLERIAAAARKAGATALLTTEKDHVRLGAFADSLHPSIPLQTVPLRIEIEDEAAVIDWLIGRITTRAQCRGTL
jgi:tetraacyldisaccharide 4'-kinase